LFLAFTLVPIAELYLLIRIGKVVGALPTLALVIVTALLGAYLAKQQGRRVISEWQAAFSQGYVPEEGVLGGLLVLLGGLLLITPGVITDFFGLFLLLPFTRKRLAAALRVYLERQVAAGNVRVQHFGFAPPHASTPFQGTGARVGRPSQRTVSHRRPRPAQGPTEVGHGPGLGTSVIVETEGQEVPPEEDPR